VREGYTDNPLWVHTWPAWIWDGAAVPPGSLPPAAPPPAPQPAPYRYRHSGDPAWESADGDPEGYGDPQPVPRPAQPPWSWEARPDPVLIAWHYADQAHILTYDSQDAEFVRELDDAACYVGHRRGLAEQTIWIDFRPHRAWPESVWRDTSAAMAQRGAESGEYDLGEDELDAVADGLFPDPEYRPGGKPSPAQFMTGHGDDDDFWSYPAPPEDTQAYVDWSRMADEDMRWRDDPYASAWHEPWPPRYETRDARWDDDVPWDGDDIRPY
jgi:hypothetical protein